MLVLVWIRMCSTNLGFSGTYGHCTWYQRALPRQLRGSPPRTRNNRADVRDNCGQRKRGCTCCLIVRVTAASKTEGVPAVSSIGFSGDNTNLGLSVGNVLFSTFVPGIGRQTTVWYQVRTYNTGLHPKTKKKHLVPASASLPIAGSALPPVGRTTPLEAHPEPATLTQSSSFSCGAGLQSESRLLLCCAPVTRDHATHVYSSVHACC